MSAGVWWGLLLGVGAASVWAWWCARRVTLERRLTLGGGPATRAVGETSPLTPWSAFERLLAPVMGDGIRIVERWGSPTQELRQRLARAGSGMSVEEFRAQQVMWAVAALAAALLLAVMLGVSRGASPVTLVVLVAAGTVAAPLGREAMLSRAIASREREIMAQLPTVAEMVALAVSAGEPVGAALERVSRSTRGALSQELQTAVTDTRAGAPLSEALEELGRRTGVVALRRFADGIATAVERGTPLAAVLRAQAQDVRAEGRRALMEQGGKKEIAMMVPVVFLILPVTVVFAIFPGVVALRLGT